MSEQKGGINLLSMPRELMERGRDVAGMGRDVWLAGLGAVATVEEEGTQLFDDLVERGRTLESRGMRQVRELRAEVGGRGEEAADRVENMVFEPLLGTLRRFGVPTRAEVRELATTVDALSKKVDALLGKLDPEAGVASPADQPVFSVVAQGEGWALRKQGRQSDISVHATKEEALDAAREYAGARAPSRLDVYRKDGVLQDSITYEA